MIICKTSKGSIALLNGATNEEFNNAIVLKEYLERKLKVC